MKKRLICFFSVLLILVVSMYMPVSAYEPVGFDISAKTAIIASIDTGDVLYSRNPDKKIYPASITKIMTVTLMLESKKYNPKGKISMTESVLKTVSGTGSSVSNLNAGDTITQLDLVYLVLMASYGDCAYLAADYYGGSLDGFVKMMNDKAEKLGLENTHYENPVGLHSPDNYTTASDTLKLTKYALKNPTFKMICETTRYNFKIIGTDRQRTVSTTNFLQDNTTNYYYPYAKGVKTGYTDEAGRCLVSTASYNGFNYICVLFGCPVDPSRRHEFVDSKNLYRWAFNTFTYKEAANEKNPVCEIGVRLSLQTDFIPLYLKEKYMTVLPANADTSTITVEPILKSDTVDAPVKKGDVLGKANIIYAEKVLGTVDLVAVEDVKRSKLLYAADKIKAFFISKYMIGVYIVLAILIVWFFVSIIRLNRGRKNKRKVKYIPYKGENHSKK